MGFFAEKVKCNFHNLFPLSFNSSLTVCVLSVCVCVDGCACVLDLPKCQRELSVDTIPLYSLGVDEDDAPQHRRIVSGQSYLPRG